VGDELVLAARTEGAEAVVSRQKIKVGESLSGRAVATGEPLAVEDLGTDARFDASHRAGALALGFHSFLGVPMTVRGQPIGAINVYSKARRRFSAGDIRLLAAFADHASLAIQKTRLLAETRAQQAQLARILESTSDGIMLVGRAGEVEAANRRAGDLLGFDPADVVGVGFGELLTGYRSSMREWEAARASLLALLDAPERAGEGDLELSAPPRVLHWAARPTRDAAGVTLGFTLTFQDVTQEREVSRMKSDFVSFVTHQLRTPLAGIRWLLELAQGEPGLPAEAGSLLRDAQDANRRLIALVNDLLDVSRLESGKLAVSLGSVDLREVTRSVLDELEPLIRDQGHRLTLEAPDGLPAALADATLIRQVLLNLLSNAIKYTPAGGAVDVRVGRAGENILWAVRDTGIGIPPEGQARLFEKFYRADNAVTLETEGTGLGLYLARLIVERLGGRVWCESEVGAGTTFKLTVPLTDRGPTTCP
jgi:PAS domain S-box-containing protein